LKPNETLDEIMKESILITIANATSSINYRGSSGTFSIGIVNVA